MVAPWGIKGEALRLSEYSRNEGRKRRHKQAVVISKISTYTTTYQYVTWSETTSSYGTRSYRTRPSACLLAGEDLSFNGSAIRASQGLGRMENGLRASADDERTTMTGIQKHTHTTATPPRLLSWSLPLLSAKRRNIIITSLKVRDLECTFLPVARS
jgi:hypothetical protein